MPPNIDPGVTLSEARTATLGRTSAVYFESQKAIVNPLMAWRKTQRSPAATRQVAGGLFVCQKDS